MKKIMMFLYVITFFLTCNSYVHARNYTFKALNTTWAGGSKAYSINDAGQIVGTSNGAVLWENDAMINLGGLPRDTSDREADDINNLGTVVGRAYDRAFLWKRGTPMIDLSTYIPNAIWAVAINDIGQIAGYIYDPTLVDFSGPTRNRAFVWTEGSEAIFLDTTNAFSRPMDINNSGQVVGYRSLATQHSRAFIWENGVMSNLGTLGGTSGNTIAYSINELGQVVGGSHALINGANLYHAFLWENGVMSDVGTLGGTFSCATDINDSGYVIGMSYDVNKKNKPFIWNKETGMLNLEELIVNMAEINIAGWTINNILRINNSGSIVGWGTLNGVSRGFVLIPNTNEPPVAAAGEDQAVIKIGSTVQLDGTQSYDLEGDAITYNWSIVSKPLNSNAVLSNTTSSKPTFQADVHGDYILELVVKDASSLSTPDQVVVSFENVIPVANAGINQSSIQGETICFDGSRSSDVNLDVLSYNWMISSMPEGSSAVLDNPTSIAPCIITDVAGTYEVSLIVNDSFINSAPHVVNVVSIFYVDAASITLQDAIKAINDINSFNFKNKNMQNTLTNKIGETLELISKANYVEALQKLQNDIIGKLDGCKLSGSPDKNDWIINCGSQNQVYPMLVEAIGYLDNM